MTTERRNDIFYKGLTLLASLVIGFAGSYLGLMLGQAKMEVRMAQVEKRQERLTELYDNLDKTKVGKDEFVMSYQAINQALSDIRLSQTELRADIRQLSLSVSRASK